MLSLEMEFIYKEKNNADQLSSEKLAIYNQVLKEQISSLIQQKSLLFQHPKLIPLMKYFSLEGKSAFNLSKGKEDLVNMLDSMDDSLKKLNINFMMTEIRQIILQFQLSELSFFDEDDDEDDFLG